MDVMVKVCDGGSLHFHFFCDVRSKEGKGGGKDEERRGDGKYSFGRMA